MAPPTPTPLDAAKAITDVSGNTDINDISAETEIKTTEIDSAKESDKLLLESADNGKFCNGAELYNGTRKSYENAYRRKSRQINTAELENSENLAEKHRTTICIPETEINERPTSEKAEIKIEQQSETAISAKNSEINNNARTHQISEAKRRKKQMTAAKETRRQKKRDSAKRTTGRLKKLEERTSNTMITTPATSTIPETVKEKVTAIEKSSPHLSGNINRKST